MSASTAHEIGIVHYPGAQVACILGLTDLFGVASTIALDQPRSGQSPLRVTHWKPIHFGAANLSCVYDSAPRGSPKPRTLIIPPTMVNLPDPDVPAGVVSWVCNRVRLSLPKRASSTAFQLPHIRFAQRRWRSVFRKSSSIRIGASLIMATSSRRADFCHGSILACFSLTGFSALPCGRRRRALFFPAQPRVRRAILQALLLLRRTEIEPC